MLWPYSVWRCSRTKIVSSQAKMLFVLKIRDSRQGRTNSWLINWKNVEMSTNNKKNVHFGPSSVTCHMNFSFYRWTISTSMAILLFQFFPASSQKWYWSVVTYDKTRWCIKGLERLKKNTYINIPLDEHFIYASLAGVPTKIARRQLNLSFSFFLFWNLPLVYFYFIESIWDLGSHWNLWHGHTTLQAIKWRHRSA